MLQHYELLRLLWLIIIEILLIFFAVTDGFDMGVGMLMRFFGRNDIERRIMINTIAPHWDSNQVWLITAGGALFAAWPMVYAAAFSSFYIAMILVIASLLFRPVSFDYRSKIENNYWRNMWDWGIFLGSVVTPIVIGVAYGNLLQGVPFTLDQNLRFNCTANFFKLLNPFSLIIGIINLAMFLTQGSTYLQLRTTGTLKVRMRLISQITSIITVVTFIIAGIWVINGIDGFTIISVINHTAESNPLHKVVIRQTGAWINNYQQYNLLYLIPTLGVIMPLLTIVFSRIKKSFLAFVCSSFTIMFIMLTAGITLFPFIMPSSIMPNASLTIWDATSSLGTLKIMTISAIIFMPIILIYILWCYYKMFWRITAEDIKKNTNSLY